MRITPIRHVLVAASSLVLLSGCTDSPTGPEQETVVTHTVNTSADWGYVALGPTVTPVAVTDPTASSAWDLGFRATSVRLNGGVGGPAGVKAYCVCRNNVAAMTTAQILAMTPESELADFTSVTAADIPAAAAAWEVGATNVAGVFSVSPWYRYNLDGQHTVSPTYQVYLIKRGSDVYKLQVTGYYGPAGETRQISFRYARL